MTPRKVERKVKAGGVAAAVGGAVVWALGTYVFHGAVPPTVTGLVDTLVPAACALAAGWITRHDRPAGH